MHLSGSVTIFTLEGVAFTDKALPGGFLCTHMLSASPLMGLSLQQV